MKKIKTHFGAQVIILCIALLAALPVRVYQYLHVIDGQTGFYNNWFDPTVFGLYGLCLAVVVLLVILSVKGGKKTVYAMPEGKQTALAISSLVLGVSFLAEGAYQAYRAFSIIQGTLGVEQLVLGDNVGKPTLLFTVLQAVFALLSAAYLFTFAVGYFTGKAQQKKIAVMAAAPAVWSVARLMLDFSQTISYRYVSELLFDILMVVFLAMFFVAFAKLSVGTLTARTQMRLFGYGFCAVFFGLLNSVPRYIVLLLGRQDLLYRNISVYEVTDLILPVFIAVFIFAVAALKQFKSVEEYVGAREKAEETAD